MLKTIYFHIGTVKTGSTLIQKMLWANKDILKKFDINYFDLVSPKLKYPRFANAEFLLDDEVDVSGSDIEQYLDELDVSSTIISEEGLWANLKVINNSVFSKYKKIIILYVRKPSEVIASWASENAEPYNATQKMASSGIGVVPISTGIEEFTTRYSRIFQNFFNTIDQIECVEVVVRPYERIQFHNHDVFCDFLKILHINPSEFFESEDLHLVQTANQSQTRKFCDISYTVWEIMKKAKMEYKYNLEAVTDIYENCKSGDERPVIDTLDDECIKKISDELEFIEHEISRRFLDGMQLFENRMPSVYKKNRSQYQPISMDEVEKLTYKYLLNDVSDEMEALKQRMINAIKP